MAERRLQLHVSETELAERRAEWSPPPLAYERGYGQLYLRSVNQAPLGCDFDFLRGRDPAGRGVAAEVLTRESVIASDWS